MLPRANPYSLSLSVRGCQGRDLYTKLTLSKRANEPISILNLRGNCNESLRLEPLWYTLGGLPLPLEKVALPGVLLRELLRRGEDSNLRHR